MMKKKTRLFSIFFLNKKVCVCCIQLLIRLIWTKSQPGSGHMQQHDPWHYLWEGGVMLFLQEISKFWVFVL
jgi:hypothetical protein